MWGIPLLQSHSARPDALAAMGLLLEAGRELGLPTLATVVPPAALGPDAAAVGDMAPLWALQAAARGAGLVAWGGWCDDGHTLDLGQLARHARQVAALRGPASVATSGLPAASHDPVNPDPELLRALEAVVRAEESEAPA